MKKKRLITEKQVLEALHHGSVVEIQPGDIITALASDTAKAKGVRFTIGPVAPSQEKIVKTEIKSVAIGSDHGGFEMKELLKEELVKAGYRVMDAGPTSDKPVDYPDFAYSVALMVRDGKADIGIMVDGAGLGSAMACNKVPGILAAPCHNEFTARNARQHNHANILTLGSRDIGMETAKSVMATFLNSVPEPGRHADRVQKIRDIESRFSR